VDSRGLRLPVTPAAGLRLQWEARSAATGWGFPDDWYHPAVDAICEAAISDLELWGPGERLGRERAALGASLGETLADVDVLIDLVPSAPAESLRRAVSLGWADRVIAPPAAVVDAMTGLASPDYLETRLGEVYASAESRGTAVSAEHALVVVRIDLLGRTGLVRSLPMVMSADVLRTVFAAGQTLALLSDRVAVVLAPRNDLLFRQAALLHDLIVQRTVGETASAGRPEVWVETLPSTLGSANLLVRDLGR
jgi:hypothetical protein